MWRAHTHFSAVRESATLSQQFLPRRGHRSRVRRQAISACSGNFVPKFSKQRNTPVNVAQPAVSSTVEPYSTVQAASVQDRGFSWTKQWYPVAATNATAKDRPHAVKLLGGDFVLWCTPDGTWHCQKDLCPHRLAPLSEGKLVGDTLQCSYHGWKFAGDGTCVDIPQAPKEKMASMCSSKRSCVTPFPTAVRYGLVWVWPDDSPARFVEAAAQELAQEVPPGEEIKPRVRKESDGTKWLEFLPLMVRSFPYSMQTLLDNALDPAHVPWSHHGVIGNRDNVTPFAMQVLQDVCEKGVSVEYSARAGAASAGDQDLKAEQLEDTVELSFKAPHTLLYDIYRGDGTRSKLLSYIVPTAAGRCTTLSISLDTRLSAQKLMATPTWLAHLVFLKAGDGDVVLLKSQEQLLAKPGKSWKDFWMPTETDKCVVLWRRWLDTFTTEDNQPYMLAKDSVEGPETNQWSSREEMLNRYTAHVATCKACSGAMQGFELAGKVASFAALALGMLGLLSGLGIWNVGSRLLTGAVAASWPLLPQVAAAALFGAAAALCLKLASVFDNMRQEFVFKDYQHAYI